MEKEPLLSSTNPSQSVEVAPLSENLPKSKTEDTWLSEIPLLPTSTSAERSTSTLSSSEPSSCESEEVIEGKFEYEFSLCFEGCLCFVHLYDTNDLSACERVIHRPVKAEEITYSPSTGNGFVGDDVFRYTFTKQPYKRTWTTYADIKTGVEYENTVAKTQRKHKMTADDILSSF